MTSITASVPKFDLRRQYRQLYTASAQQVTVIDIPDLQYLVLDGAIQPGLTPGDSPEFAENIGALYSTAYGLKFMAKMREEDPFDYSVMALEALWRTKSHKFPPEPGEPLLYTLLILQPEQITQTMFEQAVAAARSKHPHQALDKIQLERRREGRCIQMMHVGPYAEEPRTIEMLHRFAVENGLRISGPHHEIYLGDPRRSRPENLKTILRYPVTPG